MGKIFYSTILLLAFKTISGQYKPFFDELDITLNFHIGNASIEKNTWPELFKERNPSYQIDTFKNSGSGTTCIMFPFIPTSLSAGVRAGKYLFPNAEQKLLANRVEWRTGLFVGSKVQSSSFLTDQDYLTQPQIPYRYREVHLTYRRFWIDYSNQVVYKIPSWLFRKRLKYYMGTGLGLTFDANSKVSENYIQNLITQPGGNYTRTEEINTTRNENAKTITSSYVNLVGGSELKCSEKFSLLFEANYQGYINSFGMRKRLYKEGAYLSLIFHYSF